MTLFLSCRAVTLLILSGSRISVLMLLLASTAITVAQQIPPTATSPTSSSASPADDPRAESWYRIGAGDVLDVRVFNRPQLSVSVRVNEQGMVGLPLLGDVPATCRTERQLAKEIEALYIQGRFLKTPQVNVFIKDYQASSVAVIGAVNQAGRFQLQRRVRLLELLLFAGGASAIAGPSVHILHTTEAPPCESQVAQGAGESIDKNIVAYKLSDTLRSVEEANPFIWPGDIVSVPATGTAIILGNIPKSGPVSVTDQTTLSQAIYLSGGTLPNTRDEVRIRRLVPGSTARTEIVANLSAIRKGHAEDILLKAGDIVEVSSSTGFGSVMKGLMRSIVPTMSTLPVRVIAPY